MTGFRQIHRVTATPAARQAIAGLRARGRPLMFVQSAGCCGGSAPLCFRRGEFLLGSADVLLGEVEGCPFYLDRQLDSAWGRPGLVLDVEPGFAEGSSLPAGAGKHFVARAVPGPGSRKGHPHDNTSRTR
jgi:uncharacterized protein (DUF779 family)